MKVISMLMCPHSWQLAKCLMPPVLYVGSIRAQNKHNYTLYMNKLIIGIVGEMAAGKSTVTDYIIKKHDAVSFRFSDMLRDILSRLHLDLVRPNMQQLSTLLRQNFSEDIMAQVLTKDVEAANHPLIVTEGIRRPADIVYLSKLPGFVLLSIEADERLRYERLSARRENMDDSTMTWEQFQEAGTQESEQKIKKVAKSAQHRIDNNGSENDLLSQVDHILSQYLS